MLRPGIAVGRYPQREDVRESWLDRTAASAVGAVRSRYRSGCQCSRSRRGLGLGQISLFRVENFNEYINQKLTCVVTVANKWAHKEYLVWEEHLPAGWPSLAVERAFEPGDSTVTLFAGHGPSGAIDQTSRTPEDLTRSLAGRLIATGHPDQPSEAMLVMTPEHQRVFADAGWSKQRFRDELNPLLILDPAVARAGISGSGGAGRPVPKFRPGSLMIVRAGGNAGAFSAIIEGWIGGRIGSEPITVALRP